jgi:death-on-curing protein
VSWTFLNVAAVQAIHDNLIDVYGGLHGVRDPGLLESAVLRAENKANYDADGSIASIAASLSYGLVKNHAFLDGNKRIGLAALVDTLGGDGSSRGGERDQRRGMDCMGGAQRCACR